MTLNNDYYELVSVPSSNNLYRIRATEDIPRHGVKAGEYGGYVHSKRNLHGGAWLDKLCMCLDDAQVFYGAFVGGDSVVRDSAQIFGNVSISGSQIFNGNTIIHGD